MAEEKINILIVEDNPVDILMTERALMNLEIAYRLTVVRNGEQVLDYLSKQCSRVDQPDLLILDLNLPKRTGMEILEIVHQNRDLFRPFIAIVTTSKSSDELKRCSDLGAQIVITKPDDFENYQQAIHSVVECYYEFLQKSYGTQA